MLAPPSQTCPIPCSIKVGTIYVCKYFSLSGYLTLFLSILYCQKVKIKYTLRSKLVQILLILVFLLENEFYALFEQIFIE